MSLQKRILITLFVLALAWPPYASALAQTPAPEGYPVAIYLFWGQGCPHCARAIPYFERLAETHPEIILRTYEIYHNADNQQLFADMAAAHGFEASGVPTILIGPYYLVGYSEDLNPDIEAVIGQCIHEGCLDAGAGLVGGLAPVPSPAHTPTTAAAAAAATALAEPPPPQTEPGLGRALDQPHQLQLPVIGAVHLDQLSLTLSTALIAFVDGFNPCSLWVLSMLMALVLHTGSRKKVLLIGLIFLTVTAGIYALFIAGLFSVLHMVRFLGWIQALVAVVALVFGMVNIKDYFWYKKGVSFTISEKHKPGIFQNIRRVVASTDSIWALAGATVVLAAGVSLVEFSCTAGFPVLWSNLLVSQNIHGGAFAALLLLYMVIYQVDELVIFGTMVVTLKASRLEETQGRVLKLFGGVLMLALAMVMLVDPALMNDLGTSTAVFLTAFSVAALVLIVHRTILPQLGIWVGSEKQPAQPLDQARSGEGEE
jgi:thiol-disulfide isomerase/thioredoxin